MYIYLYLNNTMEDRAVAIWLDYTLDQYNAVPWEELTKIANDTIKQVDGLPWFVAEASLTPMRF